MKDKKPHSLFKIIAICFLAVFCIGAVELMVCRFAAPDTYENIIHHTTASVNRLIDMGKDWVSALSQAFTSFGKTESELEEEIAQFAEQPEQSEVPPAEPPVITEFVTRNSQEYLTGGVVDIVYYNQGEEPWADMPFGPDPISGYGCGPTAMAMLVSSLSDVTIDPGKMAEWAYNNGYCAPGSGSYLSIVKGTAKAYGLSCKEREFSDAEELCLELAAGKVYVALMRKGHFTNCGHFILLRGTTLEGNILVADPNSRERSLASWDPELILKEAKPTFWEFSTS